MPISNLLKLGRAKPERGIILIAILAILSIVPFFISGYLLRTLTLIFMWIALATNWNIIGGYMGYVDFGHIVWWGLGAYGVGIGMVEFGFPFWGAWIATGIVCFLFAVAVSSVTLKLRGHFFAISHLAFLTAALEFVLYLGITHGGQGLILPAYTNYNFFYFLMGALAALCILISYTISQSKLGYSLRAIREDEDAAEAMGVNTHFQKVKGYSIAAALTAFVGGVYAFWFTSLFPHDIFYIGRVIQMIVMCLLGGIGTLFGPILGAGLLSVIQEVLWAQFAYIHVTLVGVIMVLIILFLPEGIFGAIEKSPYSARKLFEKLIGG